MEEDLLKKRLRRRYLLVVLIILIVIGIVTFFIVRSTNTSTKNTPVQYSCNGKIVSAPCTTNKKTSTQSASKPVPKSSSPKVSIAPKTSPVLPNTSSTSSTGTQLLNTGPGNIIELFIWVTLASTIVHLLYCSFLTRLAGRK